MSVYQFVCKRVANRLQNTHALHAVYNWMDFENGERWNVTLSRMKFAWKLQLSTDKLIHSSEYNTVLNKIH